MLRVSSSLFPRRPNHHTLACLKLTFLQTLIMMIDFCFTLRHFTYVLLVCNHSPDGGTREPTRSWTRLCQTTLPTLRGCVGINGPDVKRAGRLHPRTYSVVVDRSGEAAVHAGTGRAAWLQDSAE